MSERVRSVAAALVLVVPASILAFIACAEVGTTHYGDPHSLSSANLGEAGVEPVQCGGGDAAIEASGGAGCAVSFSKDIYPSMTANGAWKCAAAAPCHGAQQNAPPPAINGTTPQTMYDSLKDFKIGGAGNPYINAGNTDPSKSSLECNVQGQCGSLMPKLDNPPGAKALSHDEICKIDAWLKCGAPNN